MLAFVVILVPLMLATGIYVRRVLRQPNTLAGSTAPPRIEQSQQDNSRRETFDSCAICLESTRYPTATNCGHIFCSECIVQYSRLARHRDGRITCPLCRRQITLLVQRGWTPAELQSTTGLEQQTNMNRWVLSRNKVVRCHPTPIGLFVLSWYE